MVLWDFHRIFIGCTDWWIIATEQCFFYSINILIRIQRKHTWSISTSYTLDPIAKVNVHEYIKIIESFNLLHIFDSDFDWSSQHKEILSLEPKQTLSIISKIGNMGANWIRIRSRKLNACDAKNHKSYSCFGSGEWMIEREADRNRSAN